MSNPFNITQIYSQIIRRNRSFRQTNNFYFFINLQQDPTKTNSTTFNKRAIGSNDLIQTSSSLLYQTIGDNLNFDSIQNIGNSSTNAIVYSHNEHNTNNLYDSFVQTVFRLPLGTIGISYTPQLQHFDDYYENERNQIVWAPIIFGTGSYINKSGYIAMLSATAPVKLVIVFLNGSPS
jgi:hypothetical protein